MSSTKHMYPGCNIRQDRPDAVSISWVATHLAYMSHMGRPVPSLAFKIQPPRLPPSWQTPTGATPVVVPERDGVELALKIAQLAIDLADRGVASPRSVHRLRRQLEGLRQSLDRAADRSVT